MVNIPPTDGEFLGIGLLLLYIFKHITDDFPWADLGP